MPATVAGYVPSSVPILAKRRSLPVRPAMIPICVMASRICLLVRYCSQEAVANI